MTTTETDGGFSAAERAAMKERAAELRAEGKKGAKKADGLQAVLDAIAKMAPDDRALAERVHVAVTSTAPSLEPKTWYGMPAYANADGKVVVFFQDSGKFKYRFSTLGFQDAANLDDGDFWPTSYAHARLEPEGREAGRGAGQGRGRLSTAYREHPSGDAELVALGVEHHHVAELVAVRLLAHARRAGADAARRPARARAARARRGPTAARRRPGRRCAPGSWRSCPRAP